MRYETFDEIFTYVGRAPKPTQEEEEETKELLRLAKLDWDCQIRQMEEEMDETE